MLEKFTVEETNLICIFNISSKERFISELTEAMPDFNDSELTEIAVNIIAKLNKMTDFEFDTLELYPEYEDNINFS